MSYTDTYIIWKTDSFFDIQTSIELALLDFDKDATESEDCFYHDLEFGTGGPRGIVGAGTNGMNRYTIGSGDARNRRVSARYI